MIIQVEGRSIHAIERGDGPPVVLVHASGLGALQWGPHLPRLAESHRTIAPDLLGYGASDPWPDAEPFSTDADLAALRAIVATVGAPVHLVGHSYGGLLALRLAHAAPEFVRSVAVFEPVAFGVLPAGDPEAAAILAATVDASFLDLATGGSPAWLRRFIDFWNGPGAWDALAPARRDARATTGRKSFLEVRALFHEATPIAGLRTGRPTLLMCGTRSPRPARAVCRVLASELPAARLDVFEGAGHMGPLEDARRFLRAITEHFARA